MAGERYVEITLGEMEKFLKEAYRALHPKKGRKGAEVIFDLSLSDNHAIFVRVYTSIYEGSGQGRSKGSDSIKVVMLSDQGRALMPPSKLVMRTKNWRSAIEDRVDEFLEVYESKVAYWKERRLNPDGKVINREDALDQAIEKSLPALTPREKEQLEDAQAEVEQERERENSREPEPLPGPKKTKPEAPFEGGYRSLPGGAWGIEIHTKDAKVPLKAGVEGVGVTRRNQRRKIRLVALVRKYNDLKTGPTEIWRFEDVNGTPRQQQAPGGYGGGGYGRYGSDPVAENVAARFLSA